jgi:phosphoglycerate dehydrogenase-like enzyme
MNKWKVMVSAPYMQPVPKKYREILESHGVEIVVPKVNERLSEEELLGLISEMDGVICGDDRFTERVIRSAPRLKVISKWGTGTDSIDRKAAEARGVAVRNTPDAFTVPVADSVLGYALCFARKLPWMDRSMKDGAWDKIPGASLSELTLGVIGVGRIGRAVLRRASSFGMTLLGHDILEVPASFIESAGVRMTSKDELLKKADMVSLNCDLNPTSRHILRETDFSMMKAGAIVINTARGPLIDEKALAAALRNKKIAGAALDVFEEEPLPADSPLRSLDNVMLAPHNSNSSPSAWERVHENTVKNLLEELGKRG